MTSSIASEPSPDFRPHRAANWITAWGVIGCMLLISSGVYRVVPHAIEPVWPEYSLRPFELVLYVGFIGFQAWAEGYRGFQKGVVPRILARAQWLTDHPERVHPIVAPLFVTGLFGMQRRALIVRYVFIVLIIGVIVAMKFVPQPWRGIVDGGVVIGLAWGVVAMGVGLVQLFRGIVPDADPQIPEHWSTESSIARSTEDETPKEA